MLRLRWTCYTAEVENGDARTKRKPADVRNKKAGYLMPAIVSSLETCCAMLSYIAEAIRLLCVERIIEAPLFAMAFSAL